MGTKRILLVITLMFVLFTTGGQNTTITPTTAAEPGVTPGKAVEGLLKRLLQGYTNRNRNPNPHLFEFKLISSEEGKDVLKLRAIRENCYWGEQWCIHGLRVELVP